MTTASTFTAFIVEENEPQKFSYRVGKRSITDLPEGELLVKVHYSSLNYKDALSATGQFGITKKYPHTPGIDVAGEVVECSNGAFKPGDKVIVTSYDLGMDTPGGYGQYIRVPSCWALPLPEGLSMRESMVLGTAGLTAGMCVWKLVRNGVLPKDGDILVTGATGGVGSVAVAILAKAGYRVIASTGKSSEKDYLLAIGAAEVIGREEVVVGADQPLMAERWAGVVDVVGGETLGAAIKATKYDGTVTCCGLVGSLEMPVGVLPKFVYTNNTPGKLRVEVDYPDYPRRTFYVIPGRSWDEAIREAIDFKEHLDTEEGGLGYGYVWSPWGLLVEHT